MKTSLKSILIILTVWATFPMYGQQIVEAYSKAKKDSLRIGKLDTDFLKFIEKGYTLALPDKEKINGVIIFLEDSKFDNKNNSANQI